MIDIILNTVISQVHSLWVCFDQNLNKINLLHFYKLEQLNSIRQTSSLAGFLCKAFNLEVVQAAAMFRPTETNPKIPCESFPDINYGLWKDYQLVHYRDKK